MRITPEIVARLIYLVSNLRYLEKEYIKDPTWENRNDVNKYQVRLDEFLEEHELNGFISEGELTEQIVLQRDYKKAV